MVPLYLLLLFKVKLLYYNINVTEMHRCRVLFPANDLSGHNVSFLPEILESLKSKSPIIVDCHRN